VTSCHCDKGDGVSLEVKEISAKSEEFQDAPADQFYEAFRDNARAQAAEPPYIQHPSFRRRSCACLAGDSGESLEDREECPDGLQLACNALNSRGR
jgi:hypothetical protein